MELKPIFSEDNDEYLEHYGVPGMKWGVRHDRPRTGRRTSGVHDANGKMVVGKNDSTLTRQVKNDYNKLGNKEFRQKYSTSKKTYAKRVAKSATGDPFRENRARMQKSKVGNAVFNISAKSEATAKASKRASSALNKKMSKAMANRTKGQKVLDYLFIGGKKRQQGYYKLRAVGSSKAGAAATTLALGGTVAGGIAEKRYMKKDPKSIKATSKQLSKYYEK